jgi:hypothetical protein
VRPAPGLRGIHGLHRQGDPVAEAPHGGEAVRAPLVGFHRRPLRDPVRPAYRLAGPYVEWHHWEAFRAPALS